jgi:lipoate-protein ligase A
MHFLERHGLTAIEQLAWEESLLEAAEEQEADPGEMLRIWELPEYCVILGRSSRWDLEVQQEAVDADRVPVLRRSSGGLSIVAGPGCLMYSLFLSLDNSPPLRSISEAHHHVGSRMISAFEQLGLPVTLQGSSDLTWNKRKFSGNSLRVRRRNLLYHGTILYRFDLSRISRYLLPPPRQPDYRQQRSHDQFVTNLPVSRDALVDRIREVWMADTPGHPPPADRVAHWIQQRYGNPSWHRGSS